MTKNPGKRSRNTPPSISTRTGSRPLELLAAGIVFACACAVFWPTLRFSFLNWDDTVYVLKNPWIRDLSWENARAIFTRPYFQNFLPMHLLSYMLDHALWGLNPRGYHLTSVLLHGLNSVLCLFVVRRLSGSRIVGFLAALLFAVHPAHVEAVAWVSSRKEVLSTTFLLLSLLAYLAARSGRGWKPLPYAASVAWFLLAMLSKVSVVVLPAFLLLVDWTPDPRSPRQRPTLLKAILAKIPYGIVGAALIAVNSRAQVTAQAAYAHEPLRYLTVKGHAVWNYLALLCGFGGNPDYDLPAIAGGVRMSFELGGLIVMPVACVLLLRWKRRSEFLGVCWIFLTLLPALLFPLVTYMADRYLYAPSIGFCMAAAAVLAGAGGLGRLSPGKSRVWAAGLAAAILVVAFAARTLSTSRVWRDSESLWTYALTKSRDYRVFNNLADVRIGQKRWAEAERLLKQGANVENVVSYQSLGVLYYSLRRFDEALLATDRAIEIQSKRSHDASVLAELHYNRGAILWSQGNAASAIEEWNAALRENPGHAQAREWLGIAGGLTPVRPPG